MGANDLNDTGTNARPDLRGWHTRGYLPHFDGGEIVQFITIHLGDALPKVVIDRWKVELKNETDAAKILFEAVPIPEGLPQLIKLRAARGN